MFTPPHSWKKICIIATLCLFGMCLVLLALSFLLINLETQSHRYNELALVPHTSVALIPGAAILRDGSLSPVLKDRVDAALRLYQAGKADNILVSGDNGTTTYNEVNPVRIYLVESGVPLQHIYLDHAGFDTYSSMYRAKEIFRVGSTTIITQSFHLPRAVYVARHIGIIAYGYNADDGHYLLKNYIRELFADVKTLLDLSWEREPKYLGDIIPIAH